MWYYDIVEKRMRITDNLDDIKWAYDEEGRIYTNDSKGQKVYFDKIEKI